MSEHVVGIDLGTTHTVVASVAGEGGVPSVFPVPQLVASGEREARALLPSCLYAPLPGEVPGDPDFIGGEFARRRGTEAPERFVASAKSWLCHPGVDRTAPILPWGGAEDLALDVPRISPLDASTRYLIHVREAWDLAHREARLASQDLVLTVPASFDDDARELTRLAAERAGLSVVLREEPQAAFYDFLAREGATEALAELGCGAVILVCDVGGGTTDLSLLRVDALGATPRISRLASGRHILLGGDNMDLALAHRLETGLVQKGEKLPPSRFVELTLACRAAKERLFGGDEAEVSVTLLGRGSRLVGGSRTVMLPRDEAERILFGGFFPGVARGEEPTLVRGALRSFGLPYERDPAITRHVSSFLRRHAVEADPPTALLLNGGVFRSPAMASAFVKALSACFDGAPRVLPHPDPDLAVARGAAAYGLARRGKGVRIGGGASRGYYVGLASRPDEPRRAVCVMPRGAEEGAHHVASGKVFSLILGKRARFDVFASDVRRDEPGAVVLLDEESFQPLPPLVARLGEGSERGEIQVQIDGELTPVGTLDLGCRSVAPPPRRFRLAFRLRGDLEGLESSVLPPPVAPVGSAPAAPSVAAEAHAQRLLLAVFGKRTIAPSREVKDLPRDLERALGERGTWPVSSARRLADLLLENPGARRRSLDHERVFFQLVGHALRPGTGERDDARRMEIFGKLWEGRLAFPDEARGWQAYFVAFRRVAAGLPEERQGAIRDFADPVLAPREAGLKRPKRMPEAQDDLLALAASLERVPGRRRAQLGEWILERTFASSDARLWDALGKLGARVLGHGPHHNVLPVSLASLWLERLLRLDWKRDAVTLARAAAQLARRTGDRDRDVSERLREATLKQLVAVNARPSWISVVRDVVMSGPSTLVLFEDDLPPGLRLAVDAAVHPHEI